MASPGVSLAVDEPARVWAALAPLLAGQQRVRLSRDGGRSYPQKHERDLTPGLPAIPAAVRIFGKDGTCRAVFLDFDSSAHGTGQVDDDVRSVRAWLRRLGARWIEDRSPNGGRHVYIPLSERVPFTEARELVEALGNRLRTLDRTPHQNLLHGCMRTPGSAHKRGGHQQLTMSLNTAYDVARRPNPPAVWKAIRADLAAEIAAARAYRANEEASPVFDAGTGDDLTRTPARMPRHMQLIASTGMYDANRYPSDSEARQAVLTGAAAAGMALTDVDRRMKQGIWPGLASFYSRYPARHRAAALHRDWEKATSWVKERQAERTGKDNAHRSPTSQPASQPGAGRTGRTETADPQAEHRFIRAWRTAMSFLEPRYRDSRIGLARRMVLRALGEAAHKTGSRFVEFGGRSLAVATGMDHTTVAYHLRALRAEQDALITLVEAGRGTRGDLYMLTIPASAKAVAEDVAWRPGKIHALRPVFRELGLPAAFVFEALEHSPAALTTAQIVRATGLSRTAAEDALNVLAAWNLAKRGPDRSWSAVLSTSLSSLAEQFGVLEAVAAQLRRYKAERERWHGWLAKHAVASAVVPHPEEDYPWHRFESPPDELTLADLAFG